AGDLRARGSRPRLTRAAPPRDHPRSAHPPRGPPVMTDQSDRYQEHLDAFGASLRKATIEHRALRPAVGRRPLLVAAGLVAAVAVVLGIAIDRGQPGTFVGEAGAREVLRAAADATRGDEVPTGWWWT